MHDRNDSQNRAADSVANPIKCPSWCTADHSDPDGWHPDSDGSVMHRFSFPGEVLPDLSWSDGGCRPRVGWEMAVQQDSESVDKPLSGHPLVYFAPSDDLYLSGGESRSLAAALVRAADIAEGLA